MRRCRSAKDLARVGVEAGDVTALVFSRRLVALAAAETLDHFAINDERAGRIAEALGVVPDHRIPHGLPGAGIERKHVRVRRGDVEPVLIDRHVAHGAVAAADRTRRAEAVFPQKLAGAPIERLDDVVDIVEIDNPVVDERRRFARARAVIHRPHPGEAQIADILFGDLLEPAMAPALITAARHQPIVGAGVLQHRVGDGREIRDVALQDQAGGMRTGAAGAPAGAAACWVGGGAVPVATWAI